MFASAIALVVATVGQAQGIDLRLAAHYFQEARWIAEEDKGALWGKTLGGPMLFVDPATRTFAANEEPTGSGSALQEGVYTGKLPPEIILANTSTQWHGKAWAMVLWPLPSNRVNRARLMMHELWHRVQSEIGLPAGSVRNTHLDTMEGRIWLILELRALRQAMRSDPAEMKPFVDDALLFRTYRQSLFPGSKAEEDRMEVHEGMAEFTGFMMQGTWEPETRLTLSYELPWAEENASLPASFAYKTGPAYGLLLNLQEKPWRKGLSPKSSLTDLLPFQPPANLKAAALKRAEGYGYKALFAKEDKREKERLEKEKNYRRLLVEGPLLELPLGHFNFSYNPNSVFPLGELGTVYQETTIVEEWGSLTVTKGARITPDFKRAYVPADGDGWKLTLKPGWVKVAGPRKGDFRLEKG